MRSGGKTVETTTKRLTALFEPVRALIAGALVVAAFAAPLDARAQTADELFAAVLRNPSDVEANLAFARAAEAEGALRHALAAYERVARTDPNNVEARRAYRRMQIALLPPRTSINVRFGAAVTDNVRLTPSDSVNAADVFLQGSLDIFDDRAVAGLQWRTLGEAAFRLHESQTELDQYGVGLWTGPVFATGDHSEFHLALGGSLLFADDRPMSADISALGSFRVLDDAGRPQLFRLYLAHRDVIETGPALSDAFFLEASARLWMSGVVGDGDALFLLPRLRISAPYEESGVRGVDEPFFVENYIGYGARVAYYAPLLAGRLFAGAGIGVYDRIYQQNVFGGSEDRRDLYVEPTAHLIFTQFTELPVDLRLEYRGAFNTSNDSFERYEAHTGSVSMTVRF